MLKSLTVLLLSICSASLIATASLPQETKQETERSAFLIICDINPSKIIVLDDAGKWMHRVRETEIKIDGNAIMKCTMYEGHYRPSSPEVKSWKLAQIKAVSETEFQAMINNLQNDPEAVRKQMSQESKSN